MRVLVVGAGGLLGSNVVVKGLRRDEDVVGTYHHLEPDYDCDCRRLDVRDGQRIDRLIADVSPDVLVNCAAMTDVDNCEENPQEARAVNGEAPRQLADRCADIGARLIHVSTDYVFDGETASPYVERAEPNPVQAYGGSKLAGEQAVRESGVDAVILRLSFVYGIHRATDELVGFPAWVRDRILKGEPTTLFVDQRATPSRAGQVASVVYELLDREVTGTYHVASRSCISPYHFGRRIHDRLSGPPDILESGSIDEMDRPAARPAYTCLDVGRIETILGSNQPHLSEDLDVIDSALRP